MNLQQSIHSKLSANGFGRRRGDRDVAAKFVNKFQPGKSNPSRLTNARAPAGSKDESFGSSSGDRLVYLTTCFVGQHVDVQVKNGSMYSGIFHSTNAEKDFGIILKMAHLTKDTSSRGQKPIGDSLIQAPSRTLVIPAKELVQVIAKDVTVTKDGLSNEVHNENQELLIDSFISHSCHVEAERELKPWIPDDDSPQFPELDSIFDCPWNRVEESWLISWIVLLNQAQPFQTNIGVDLSRSTPINHARQLASETSCKSWPTLEIESRIQDKQNGENDAEESVEKDRQAANDSQFAKCDDLQPLKKDGPDEGTLSDVALRAPSCASSKHNEKLNPPALSDDPESGKSRGEVQVLNPTGRPGSSRSLNSDGAAGTSSGPVLSPSSSIGSLSSEKSTLNPHAKEFKFNPNAKSFTPSQAPVRPPSPAPDGSFYYQSNMPAVPHMHGMPYGVGIGPSFAGHQPVVLNPMVAPMQSPHAYAQPNGPQYAQPMLLGHPRPAMYMLGYQPEMPYKGREY
ncbi:Polyadenylate-binding protein-interacting protein 4, partial [Cucurbita argyrosperma subsp. sororia]